MTVMKIAQDQRYEGEDWWDWSVWIDAPSDELAQVERVVWHLHPTFPDNVREHTNRHAKFRLETAGWGTFRVRADVFMKGGGTHKLVHELQLHYPKGERAPG
jgi:transcription initiation factor IIF auxiliary subunit